MDSIAAVDSLRPGDVVHHPAFGFATVAQIDDRGAELRWSRDPTGSPTHVSRHALSSTWRRCRPGGILARHSADPESVRRLAGDDPVALLGLLLVELSGQGGVDDLREWAQTLIGETNFAGWWGAVLVLAGVDGRFLVDLQHVALAPGVTERDFTEPVAASVPTDDEPIELDNIPLAAPRRDIDAPRLWTDAHALAHALAALHARGATLLRNREACTLGPSGWRLQADAEPAPPQVDVTWACRRLIEVALGADLPAVIPDHELVDLVPAALPVMPPELLGVLRYAFARSPSLRPADGLALTNALAVAHAVARTREELPPMAHAQLVAGFDTHIGTFKALAGQTNQDSFLVLGDPEHALVMVADGISTATAGSGDLASSLAARTLRLQWTGHHEELRRAGPSESFRFLGQALDRANRVVCEAAVRLAGGDLARHVPMGTTIIAALTHGDTVHLAALGDSRAWVVGRHGVAPLSWDQNLNALRLRQAASGAKISWDDRGYALIGYLGHFDEMGDPALPALVTRTVRLLPGEWLILASDGVSDHAAEEEAAVYRILETLVAEHGQAYDARAAMRLARRIVLAANDGTGGDNATVLTLTLSAKGPGPAEGDPLAD